MTTPQKTTTLPKEAVATSRTPIVSEEQFQVKQVTPAMIAQLNEPLPKEAVSQHPTKSYLSTIKAIYVVERLNQVFGLGRWFQRNEIVEKDGKMVVIHSYLDIPEYGIHLDNFGGNDNADLGDAYKGAATDALTKMAAYLGIGMDVYKGLAAHGQSTHSYAKAGTYASSTPPATGPLKNIRLKNPTAPATPAQKRMIAKLFSGKGRVLTEDELHNLDNLTMQAAHNMIESAKAVKPVATQQMAQNEYEDDPDKVYIPGDNSDVKDEEIFAEASRPWEKWGK